MKRGDDAIGYLAYPYKREEPEKRRDDTVGYLTYGYKREE
jgi:hypothetical protein